MSPHSSNKFKDSLQQLTEALAEYRQSNQPEHLRFLTVAKAFEVAIEYTWKELKRAVEDQGLEADSPKDAVRQAAKLKLIQNPDRWIHFINTRNQSTHDYYGVSDQEYLKVIEEFLVECLTIII